MRRKNVAGTSTLDKADDAPELTDAFFAAATVREGTRIVRLGRPRSDAPKQLVTIRLPPGILARLRRRPKSTESQEVACQGGLAGGFRRGAALRRLRG